MNLGISELVIIFAIITLIVLVTAMVSGVGIKLSKQLKPTPTSPLEIVRARYARGEITRDQFEQIKRDLQ